MSDTDIGDRHLLGAPGLQKPGAHPAWRVRIVVDDSWAHATAGQLLVSALVNLLCRMIGIVRHIDVVVSPSAARIVMPDGHFHERFLEGLAAIPSWAVNNRISLSFDAPADLADFTILVGCGHNVGTAISVVGDGWCTWVGSPEVAPKILPVSNNPLGPLLAAALAAGEVFKRHCGLAARGKLLTGVAYSLWSGETASRWEAVAAGPDADGCKIDPLHLIGAGAIGNDAAYILGYLKAGTYAVLIDGQTYSKTNLNRCLVSGWKDQTRDKVNSVSRFLKASEIESFPFVGTIKDYIASPRRGMRDDIAKSVEDFEFGTVLSCVDNNLARHDVQGLGPRVLLGGSSLGLQAKTQFYSGRADAPCLACFHPVEPHAARFASLKEKLKSMSECDRHAFFVENNMDAVAVEKYLQDPDCGGLGEAALREFVTTPPDEFSVSFVSLGAAALLVASLLRRTVFADTAPVRDDFMTLNFLNGNLHDHAMAADDACERRCQSST